MKTNGILNGYNVRHIENENIERLTMLSKP